jgi:hypothetical protein
MTRKNILASLGFAALVALPSMGCVVHGRASGGAYVSGPTVTVVEVEQEPPPPRHEVVVVRPGFVWISGRWTWSGGRYVWADGYYERERAGYIYAPGRWERRGRGHVWVDGRWNASARVNAGERYDDRQDVRVRDHRGRDDRRDDDRGNGGGPVIRDHRH